MMSLEIEIMTPQQNVEQATVEDLMDAAIQSAVELNRLLLKFLVLCHVDILESSLEDNATFNFLG